MKQKMFQDGEFGHARIFSNNLEFDPSRSLEEQFRDLDLGEDLIVASFLESGYTLSVDWRPSNNPAGKFYVTLNRNPEEWKPFKMASGRSLEFVRDTVREFMQFVERATLRYAISSLYLIPDGSWLYRHFHTFVNKLLIDMAVPLADQAAKFRSKLFEMRIAEFGLTVTWSPPSDPAGEFVVRLQWIPDSHRLPPDARPNERVPRSKLKPWVPYLEKRCKTIAELQSTAREYAQIARRAADLRSKEFMEGKDFSGSPVDLLARHAS